ncbi:MAG: pilus assembly protein PilO [Sphaerospermopsis sp. SIO1G2]|nr:pilus assembly protein PilO [Sphaerospermopsis sp. SIO1G1]NET72617.1 pilus assembly protein PilO [Sphaerospermopsis sp. SIO1G2]
MTLSDDISFSKSGAGFDEPSYIVAFGITFTPKIIGIVVGSLGFLGGVYMIMNSAMPAWESFQKLQTQSAKLERTVAQKRKEEAQIDQVRADLDEAKTLQSQVLKLFANESSLDTLLLDTNSLINRSNDVSTGSSLIKAQLKRFAPEGEKPEIINDGSLGEKVDNKLKRQIIKVEIEGRFEQMQSIMKNIERLQPLLLVENYNSQLIEPEIDNTNRDRPAVRSEPGKILTTFDLVALMPLNEEEADNIAKAKQAEAAKAAGNKR